VEIVGRPDQLGWQRPAVSCRRLAWWLPGPGRLRAVREAV